ncbi:MAG TPA: hypothetical protein VJO72_00220 [Candidatus Dormibacteraeota bacterium]|nr:hypothetical protein [Candidatus Dormibacteraeota bacterium]
MRRKKAAAKTSESAGAKGRLARLRKQLPKVKPGTPAPLVWAASGALIGIGVSLGSAAMSASIRHNLQFVGLILSSLLNSFPVAMAGALMGAFLALGWFGCRR